MMILLALLVSSAFAIDCDSPKFKGICETELRLASAPTMSKSRTETCFAEIFAIKRSAAEITKQREYFAAKQLAFNSRFDHAVKYGISEHDKQLLLSEVTAFDHQIDWFNAAGTKASVVADDVIKNCDGYFDDSASELVIDQMAIEIYNSIWNDTVWSRR